MDGEKGALDVGRRVADLRVGEAERCQPGGRVGLIEQPVAVLAVRDREDGRLDVQTSAGTWIARAIVNATGSWDRPFVP